MVCHYSISLNRANYVCFCKYNKSAVNVSCDVDISRTFGKYGKKFRSSGMQWAHSFLTLLFIFDRTSHWLLRSCPNGTPTVRQHKYDPRREIHCHEEKLYRLVKMEGPFSGAFCSFFVLLWQRAEKLLSQKCAKACSVTVP